MGLSKALYMGLLAGLILSMIGCGGTVSAAGPGGTNPQILSLSPSVANVASNITLQVQGENFSPESQVVWNGFVKPTAFVSATLLTAKISSADLARPSTATVYVNDSKSNLKSNASHVKVVGPLTVTSTTLGNAVVGSGFSTTLTASGGKSPYTWGAETAVPAGLSLSSSGSLTGTPTQAGTFSFGVKVQDRSMPRLTASATVSLTVVSGGSKLSATSEALPAATTGKSYTAALTESGGSSPYAWSATSSLPPGLSLNSTGALSGTPTTAGKFSFTAQVKDSSSPSQSSSGSYTISVSTAAAPLIVATTSLPGATSGTSYSNTLSASGGTAPYTWSATTAIPAGLALNSNGVLSGTPTTSGTFSVGVKVIDTASPAQSATAILPLTIAAAPTAPLAISTSSIPNGTAGQSYNVSLIATGGTSPYHWSASTAVPAGLTFSSSGTLSGTPSSSGTYTFGAKVVDSSSVQKSATANFTFTVAAAASTPVSIATSSVPAATSGTGYSYGLSATGGTSPYTWALAGGALPSGLSLSSTGTISGTPTATGTSGFTAKVTDSKGATASGTFSMTVSAPPTSSGGSATPKMPQVYVDTSYPAVTGTTIYVHAGGNLQSAIDNANPGDQIVLDAGATFTGSFMLRYKTGQDSNTNYIVIRSSGTLPAPGTRVSPSNASSMARIQSNNTVPAFQTEFGAHHYRLVGLEITKVTDPSPTYAVYADLSYGIMWFGGQAPGSTVQYPSQTSELPHHVIVDRCYIHGDYNAPHGETYRGIMMNGNYIGVVDSYISNIHSENIEVQGLESFSANGPFKIVNNYIEAAGENVIFGGTDPKVPNAVPSDIEFRHNYLSKPLTWDPYDPSYKGVNYSVKNLFELKNAQRVWVDGNVMEHNWVKSQDGKAVLFTVRNQSGNCSWCVVQDITFTNNIVRGTAGVFNTISVDYNYPSQQMQRVLVQNNLFYDLGGAKWGDTGGYGIFASVNGSQYPGGPHYTILNMTFDHNTAFPTKDVLEMDNAPAATNLVFTNNLVTSGSYGIFGSGYGTGTPAINEYLLSPTFGGDVLIGGATSGPYPTGVVTPNSLSDVGFVNYSGGDFHLSSSSPYKNAGTDGKDIGADVDQINSKTNCVLQGSNCQ